MLDQTQTSDSARSEPVEYVAAGTPAAGAYHCSGCGYGITVHTELPNCPMCAGSRWEPHDWSPFTQPSRLH